MQPRHKKKKNLQSGCTGAVWEIFHIQQLAQPWFNYEQPNIWVEITQHPLGNAFYQHWVLVFPVTGENKNMYPTNGQNDCPT